MHTEKHNPDCKLISATILTNVGFAEVVYGEKNDGTDKGLEIYFYRRDANHFYTSRRWTGSPHTRIPSKYHNIVLMLNKHIADCPAGHKLYLPNHKLIAA